MVFTNSVLGGGNPPESHKGTQTKSKRAAALLLAIAGLYTFAPERSLAIEKTGRFLKEEANITRTVWFLGNSVSRGHYYSALSLFDGKIVDKDTQKNECGAGGLAGGRRPGQGDCYGTCHCTFSPKPSLRFAFVWQQRIIDEELCKMIVGEDSFGLAVKPQDTVFLNAGVDDIAIDVVGTEWNRTLIEDASKLAGVMRKAQDFGANVYFRATTMLCPLEHLHEVWGQSVDSINDKLHISNVILTAAMNATGVPVLVPRQDCADFLDVVHPNENLSSSHVADFFLKAGVPLPIDATE